MKLKREDKMYVQLKDILFLGVMPSYVCKEMKIFYNQDCFLLFKDKRSVEFFESKEEIVDYNFVSSLSDAELDDEILKLYSKLNDYSLEWLQDSQNYRKLHLSSKEYHSKITSLEYKITAFISFRKNRVQNQVKQCANCALEYSIIPYLCDGCNESYPHDYKNYIPFKLLELEEKIDIHEFCQKQLEKKQIRKKG